MSAARRAWYSFMLLTLVGCGPALAPEAAMRTARESAEGRLRDHPTDAATLAVAAALTLLDGGTPTDARERLASALAAHPDDGRLHYEAAWTAVLEGRPAAFESYAREALAALEPPAPERAVLLELLRDQADQRGRPDDSLRALFMAHAEDADRDVRHVARRGLLALARKAGERDEIERWTAALGLVTSYRISAPWTGSGARSLAVLLAPERLHLEHGGGTALPSVMDHDDDGWRRTIVTDARRFDDGKLTFAELHGAGSGFGETTMTVSRGGEALVTLESPVSARLYVNGRALLSLDGLNEATPQVSRARARLAPGTHRLLVKVVQRERGGYARVSVTPLDSALEMTPGGPEDSRASLAPPPRRLTPSSLSLLDRLGKEPLTSRNPRALYDHLARWFIARQEPWRSELAAEKTLAALIERAPAGAVLRVIAAHQRLSASHVPHELRLRRAERELDAAEALVGPGFQTLLHRAELLAAGAQGDQGRLLEALEILDRALALTRDTGPRAGDGTALRLRLDLLARLGWWSEAEEAYAQLLRAPLSLANTTAALAYDGHRGRFGRALELAARFERVAPGEAAGLLARMTWLAGDYDEARRVLARALELDPASRTLRRYEAQLARLAQGGERELSVLEGDPADRWLQQRLGERLWLDGRHDEALAIFRALSAAAPGNHTLRRIPSALTGQPPVGRSRLDGRDWIDRFEASLGEDSKVMAYERHPGVTVLDDTAILVFDDGSSARLRHVVRRIQSKSMAERGGEFRLGARDLLLEARTLKADGAIIEPERVPGKPTLSFSGLAPGDYTELKVLSFAPSQRGTGGALGVCAAGSWGMPTFALRCRVMAPEAVPLDIVLHNGMPAPAVTVARADEPLLALLGHPADEPVVVMHDFGSRRLPAMRPEPHAAPALEFVPFAELRFGAPRERDRGWRALVAGLSATLSAALKPSLELRELARELAHGRDAEEQIRAAFGFARDEVAAVGGSGQAAGSAAAAVATRTGNPSVVLMALLREMGFAPQLLLCRPRTEARLSPLLPSPLAYGHPIVSVCRDRRRCSAEHRQILDVTDRHLPFDHLQPALDGARCLIVVDSGEISAVPEVSRPTPPPATEVLGAREGDQDKWEFHIDLVLEPNGDATGTLTARGRGVASGIMRQALGATQPEEQEVLFESWLREVFPAVTVERVESEGIEERDHPLEVRLALSVSGLARVRQEGLELPRLLPASLGHGLSGRPPLDEYVRLSERASPLALVPYGEAVTMTLEAPGATWRDAAFEVDFAEPGLEMTFESRADGAVLKLRRRVEVRAARVAPEEYDRFRQALLQVLEAGTPQSSTASVDRGE